LGLFIAFQTSWQMSLMMFAIAPFLIGGILFVTRLMNLISNRAINASGVATTTATEVFSSMRTVRSLSAERREIKRYWKDLSVTRLIAIPKAFGTGISLGAMGFLFWMAIAIAFWYGGYLIKISLLTIGGLFKVFGMILISVLGLSQILNTFPLVSKTFAASQILLKIMNRTPQINFIDGKIPDKLTGNICFKNIFFRYPSRRDQLILDNFNVDVPQGSVVALVGESGSGKSTCLGLLERFYEQEKGTITLDGVDIREIDPFWLHSKMVIVTQEPVLFSDTIANNILYGNKHADMDDVIEAAKNANAHNFIDTFPKKYDTLVGERGSSLSGGEKQRIAIARAIIQNPRILLLDEATSALDSESEKLVQDALEKLMKGRTCIVIAHRLTTIKDADKILVMDRGVIRETGTHQELLKIENGLYYQLAKRQMEFAN